MTDEAFIRLGFDRPGIDTQVSINPQTEALRLEHEIARAIHPIIAGALTPLAVYFGGIVFVYYLLETTLGFVVMAPLSLATAALLLIAEHRWLSTYRSIAQLEVTTCLVGILIYLNIMAFVHFHPEPSRLSYFLLYMMSIVTISATLRTVVAGGLLALVTMLWKASTYGPGLLEQYAMLGVACAFVAFGMVSLMRGAIERTVKARMLAETLRAQAQDDADKDALTGLPNRRVFLAEVEALLAIGAVPQPFCIGIIDLDGFKPVNDVYGHAIGDQLLAEVGVRLHSVFGQEHLVARLGGDEFSLLVTRQISDAEVLALGRRAIEALRKPFVVANFQISISASAGFAQFPRDGMLASQIYERADHALYRAKNASRGDIVIFNKHHEAEFDNLGRVEHALRTSDLANELSLVFQPQVDTETGRTVGFEALARWTSSRLGPVSPSIFITSAEKCGMIEAITDILLRKTLDAMKGLPADLRVAFNLSARDLVSEQSMVSVCTLVRDSGIDPNRLEFEITETAMMKNFECARKGLEMLSAMGCRIALDDFGSGYSSFGYIQRFPLDKLKLDRSFLTSSENGTVSQNIIHAIVELCRNIGVDCLIEGVENEAQLRTVQTAGVRYVQGYYFSRPMPMANAVDYIDDERMTLM